jgi:hypothetical protein
LHHCNDLPSMQSNEYTGRIREVSQVEVAYVERSGRRRELRRKTREFWNEFDDCWWRRRESFYRNPQILE